MYTDSPTGRQYHIRYTPKNGDKHLYWTTPVQDPEVAGRELDWYLKNGYDDAKIFVRDVSPWREATS